MGGDVDAGRADTNADTAPDTAPDTQPDTQPDTEPDTLPDTAVDTTPDPCDVDRDGVRAMGECGGEDCDDENPAVFPDAPIVCGDDVVNRCGETSDIDIRVAILDDRAPVGSISVAVSTDERIMVAVGRGTSDAAGEVEAFVVAGDTLAELWNASEIIDDDFHPTFAPGVATRRADETFHLAFHYAMSGGAASPADEIGVVGALTYPNDDDPSVRTITFDAAAGGSVLTGEPTIIDDAGTVVWSRTTDEGPTIIQRGGDVIAEFAERWDWGPAIVAGDYLVRGEYDGDLRYVHLPSATPVSSGYLNSTGRIAAVRDGSDRLLLTRRDRFVPRRLFFSSLPCAETCNERLGIIGTLDFPGGSVVRSPAMVSVRDEVVTVAGVDERGLFLSRATYDFRLLTNSYMERQRVNIAEYPEATFDTDVDAVYIPGPDGDGYLRVGVVAHTKDDLDDPASESFVRYGSIQICDAP